MANEETIKKLLVDMDCLLDTRIGTVSLLNEEAACKLLSEKYSNRVFDDFEELTEGLVTNEEFSKRWETRDKETLKASMMTNIMKLLVSLTSQYEKDMIETPFVKEFILYVNLHPYILTDAEIEIIKEAISVHCGINLKIRTIHLPLEKITPKKLKEDFDGFITYSFDNWLKIHSEALDKTPIPRVTIFAPALCIKKPNKLEDIMVDGLTVFEMLEIAYTARLHIEFLKANEFSIFS